MPDLVPVEQVTAGDQIVRPSGTTHDVIRVEHYDATYGKHECWVVVYRSHEQSSYENKARDKSGFNVRPSGAIEKSWKPLAAGDTVPIIRRAA